MKIIHEGMLAESGTRKHRELTIIQFASSAGTFLQVGVHERLTKAAHEAVHDLASRRAVQMKLSHTVAFAQLMSELARAGRPRKKSERFVHFIALAWAYGVRFASLKDATESVNHAHLVLAPAIRTHNSHVQRVEFWDYTGRLMAVVGHHAQDPTFVAQCPDGLTADLFIALVDLITKTRGQLRLGSTLCLLAQAQVTQMDLVALTQLLVLAPARSEELLGLIHAGELTDEGVSDLLEEPELYLALSAPALEQILSFQEPEDDFRELGLELAEDLRRMNAQALAQRVGPAMEEEDGPLPDHFDHKSLDVAEFVGGRYSLEAIQLVLVFGILQPDRKNSSALGGSLISRNDLLALIEPHRERQQIHESSVEKAFGFLSTIGVLGSSKRGCVRFNRHISSNPRGKGIAGAIMALNAQIER
jgi:hypothetical protein